MGFCAPINTHTYAAQRQHTVVVQPNNIQSRLFFWNKNYAKSSRLVVHHVLSVFGVITPACQGIFLQRKVATCTGHFCTCASIEERHVPTVPVLVLTVHCELHCFVNGTVHMCDLDVLEASSDALINGYVLVVLSTWKQSHPQISESKCVDD